MVIRILIADDQRLMREGLETILNLGEDMEVVGTASNGLEALKMCRENAPDVVLMDIQMPVMDGVEAAGLILEENPSIRVIALTTFDDDELIVRALKAGARTYLLKDLPSEKLMEAIRATARGDVLLQPEVASRLVKAAAVRSETEELPAGAFEPLSNREREILSLMVAGLSNQEIAADLFLSEGTVKNYISAIYSKLGVKDRTQAVLFAMKHRMNE
ncbi:MAG: response regulator transcription factor [Bacillota bacterium]